MKRDTCVLHRSPHCLSNRAVGRDRVGCRTHRWDEVGWCGMIVLQCFKLLYLRKTSQLLSNSRHSGSETDCSPIDQQVLANLMSHDKARKRMLSPGMHVGPEWLKYKNAGTPNRPNIPKPWKTPPSKAVLSGAQPMLLCADVGGTNTRLHLFKVPERPGAGGEGRCTGAELEIFRTWSYMITIDYIGYHEVIWLHMFHMLYIVIYCYILLHIVIYCYVSLYIVIIILLYKIVRALQRRASPLRVFSPHPPMFITTIKKYINTNKKE